MRPLTVWLRILSTPVSWQSLMWAKWRQLCGGQVALRAVIYRTAQRRVFVVMTVDDTQVLLSYGGVGEIIYMATSTAVWGLCKVRHLHKDRLYVYYLGHGNFSAKLFLIVSIEIASRQG